MFDFPTILCCLNYANIYCLELTCLITTLSIFPLNLLGIINIKWDFVEFFVQILYSINLAGIAFVIFTIIFITLSTTSKKILLTNYNKSFSQIAIMSTFIYIFLFCSYSICAFFILNDFYKIKRNKFNFKKFNKYEIQKVKDYVEYKKNWVFLFLINLIPIFFCFLNIFLWISIYYRIYFRIYCSFNYDIRMELKKSKKRDMTKLEEEITNGKEKNKKDKIENIEISVVFEKDRHPSAKNNFANIKKFNDLQLGQKIINGYKEELSSGGSSTKRNFN